MRILTAILVMLVVVTCLASLPPYGPYRQLIEEHTQKDKTPKKPWVFVDADDVTTNYSYDYILHYHDGITLRDVVDATRYRSSNEVFVVVVRNNSPKGPVFFDYVKATERPKFKLREQDVVLLMTEGDMN
ncbi:MAG TPA: hypothetical protein VMD27_02885 [Candidatus Aquilonibacter sp.]|nr:hypothetical protein [Candidatus Aquilonibacter sp.]